MASLNELLSHEVPLLPEALQRRQRELEETMGVYQHELRSIVTRIKEFTEIRLGTVRKPVVYPIGYKPNMTWLQKISYILNIKGKERLTAAEIVETILNTEVYQNSNKETIVRSVSATLSTKTKQGFFLRGSNERNEHVYSLPERKSIQTHIDDFFPRDNEKNSDKTKEA